MKILAEWSTDVDEVKYGHMNLYSYSCIVLPKVIQNGCAQIKWGLTQTNNHVECRWLIFLVMIKKTKTDKHSTTPFTLIYIVETLMILSMSSKYFYHVYCINLTQHIYNILIWSGIVCVKFRITIWLNKLMDWKKELIRKMKKGPLQVIPSYSTS